MRIGTQVRNGVLKGCRIARSLRAKVRGVRHEDRRLGFDERFSLIQRSENENPGFQVKVRRYVARRAAERSGSGGDWSRSAVPGDEKRASEIGVNGGKGISSSRKRTRGVRTKKGASPHGSIEAVRANSVHQPRMFQRARTRLGFTVAPNPGEDGE